MLRRVIILATGTISGVIAIVAYHPPQLTQVAILGVATPAPTTPGQTTAKPAPPSKPQTAAGTFVGNTAQTQWGPVQVQITVSNGQITTAKALRFPNGDRRSQSISQQAVPFLIQQTLTTKSATVVGVSGASYTSDGWRRSLASARAKARI